MTVLVTGGAGYIGSHAVRHLLDAGHGVVVVDNLVRGHRESVPEGVPFFELDTRRSSALSCVMSENGVDAVMHFAALAYVGESVREPIRYHANNVGATIGVLEAMQTAGVKRIVFSSTCATYGEPEIVPIVEETPQQPVNPYGWSKWMAERLLRDQAAADPEFGFTALRYFNVAGCREDGSIGENHDPETHLIPLVLQVALGRREAITVFGTDYDTPDGTCIRDYVHVDDLCRAHLTALEAINPGTASFLNLGIGRGYSVREVIESCRRVTGHPIPVMAGERRPGDPPTLFANADRIREELAWSPRFVELDEIVETAWRWFRSR